MLPSADHVGPDERSTAQPTLKGITSWPHLSLALASLARLSLPSRLRYWLTGALTLTMLALRLSRHCSKIAIPIAMPFVPSIALVPPVVLTRFHPSPSISHPRGTNSRPAQLLA